MKKVPLMKWRKRSSFHFFTNVSTSQVISTSGQALFFRSWTSGPEAICVTVVNEVYFLFCVEQSRPQGLARVRKTPAGNFGCW